MSTEVEAKFLVDEATLESIAARRRVGRYVLEPRPEKRLRTVYLDTRDRRLWRGGVALRIRYDAHGVEASVKSGGGVEGDVHKHQELTVVLDRRPRFPFRPPPGPLRDAVEALASDRALEPLVETRVRRKRRLVRRGRRGAPIAEIALDRVKFHKAARGPSRKGASSPGEFEIEIEIELLEGGREKDLDAIVERLRADHRLRASPRSKLERALAWAKRYRRAKPRS